MVQTFSQANDDPPKMYVINSIKTTHKKKVSVNLAMRLRTNEPNCDLLFCEKFKCAYQYI